MSSETIHHIIASAESQARSGGYNAFSFRGIAKEIGIKSASIHYHFPTQENPAAELARRYTPKFNQCLLAITQSGDNLHQELAIRQSFLLRIRKTIKKCASAVYLLPK